MGVWGAEQEAGCSEPDLQGIVARADLFGSKGTAMPPDFLGEIPLPMWLHRFLSNPQTGGVSSPQQPSHGDQGVG